MWDICSKSNIKIFWRIVTCWRWILQPSRFLNKLPLLKSVIRYQFFSLKIMATRQKDLIEIHDMRYSTELSMLKAEMSDMLTTYTEVGWSSIWLTNQHWKHSGLSNWQSLMPTVMTKNWSILLFSSYGFTCWLWSVNTMNVCTMNVSPVKHMEILIRLTGL